MVTDEVVAGGWVVVVVTVDVVVGVVVGVVDGVVGGADRSVVGACVAGGVLVVGAVTGVVVGEVPTDAGSPEPQAVTATAKAMIRASTFAVRRAEVGERIELTSF